jgi:transposase
MELTVEQVILQSVPKKDSRGRKPRDVLNGILWILRTGAPDQTCHRRLQEWSKRGILRRIIEELTADLQERGGIDLREAFIDSSFVPAKKEVAPSAGQSAAKAAGSWLLRTLPVFLSPSVLCKCFAS